MMAVFFFITKSLMKSMFLISFLMMLFHQVSGPVISQASDTLQGLVGAQRELYMDQFAGQFNSVLTYFVFYDCSITENM